MKNLMGDAGYDNGTRNKNLKEKYDINPIMDIRHMWGKDEKYKEDEQEKKYDLAYTAYLEALDKYVMDSIYKKVKNNTATEFEKDALSRYYEVTSLKEKEYMDYKYRKQKYLIELDWEGIKISGK